MVLERANEPSESAERMRPRHGGGPSAAFAAEAASRSASSIDKKKKNHEPE